MAKISFAKSAKLFEKALHYLPAGVSSNARLWRSVCPSYMPCSLFIKRAHGSRIWDVDGNEYIDYRLGFGPVVLGHSYRKVHQRVHQIDQNGLVFALSHELEVKVAKRINSMVPCADMVRFCNSGTEATMHSLRVARAFTGREKVVKFEGMYHGAHDYLLFSIDPGFGKLREATGPVPASQGIPKTISDLVLTLPWNDFDAVDKTVSKWGGEIAAVITEPIMGNCSAITPEPGYLKHLRQVCDEHGIVLIFDEVKTGFRVSSGGAQKLYGITPDMATFAKSLGNGYPIAALTGKREIMEVIGPAKVVHGGTYSGNPVSLAAADATLQELAGGRVYTRLQRYGERLMKDMRGAFEDHHVDALVLGVPQMMQFLPTEKDAIRQYRDLEFVDFQLFAKIHFELLKNGIMIDEDGEEVWFTSYSHSNEDLERTHRGLENALTLVQG